MEPKKKRKKGKIVTSLVILVVIVLAVLYLFTPFGFFNLKLEGKYQVKVTVNGQELTATMENFRQKPESGGMNLNYIRLIIQLLRLRKNEKMTPKKMKQLQQKKLRKKPLVIALKKEEVNDETNN